MKQRFNRQDESDVTLKECIALGIMSRSAILDHAGWGVMKKQPKELEKYVVLHDDRSSLPTHPTGNYIKSYFM